MYSTRSANIQKYIHTTLERGPLKEENEQLHIQIGNPDPDFWIFKDLPSLQETLFMGFLIACQILNFE